MAYVISDDCIACGACADGCPVNAISEGDGKYVINFFGIFVYFGLGEANGLDRL